MRGSTSFRRNEARRLSRKADKLDLQSRALNGKNPKQDEVEIKGVAFKVPNGNSLNLNYGDISDHALLQVIEGLQDPIGNIKKNEPSDQYVDFNHQLKSSIFRKNENYPDGWRQPIYPAGKTSKTDQTQGRKPNIQGIRQWVEDVKLAGKSQRELELEYNTMYEQDSMNGWDDKKMERLINSIAFAVSRKIWYVGRKPSSMSNKEWEKDTKDMRPSDGSYNKGQKGRKYGESGGSSVFTSYKTVPENWGERGNPYVQEEYSYSSGDPDHNGSD